MTPAYDNWDTTDMPYYSGGNGIVYGKPLTYISWPNTILKYQ